MTELGALASGLAVLFLALAARGTSSVERRLRAVVAARTGRAIDRARGIRAPTARIASAAAGALVGGIAGAVLALGPAPAVVLGYAGLVIPAIERERRRSAARREADRVAVTVIEWLHALVACGRPVETAVLRIAERRIGDPLLDAALERVRAQYSLGVPMHEALALEGRLARVDALERLAERLERARDLGRGVLPLLADLRDELRAQERARALERASHVEGKLTLVLTLCYLPALALLVIIPLFLTLLAGLFG